MKVLFEYLAVGVVGSLGAMLRLLVATACGRIFGSDFPVGTLVINVSGCVLLGWFMTIIGDRLIVSDTVRLAVAVGFVGSYTTFSTFAYESNTLLQDGAVLKAGLNLVGSVLLGLLGVRFGIWLGGR
jgi:fluoride exporter